MCYKKGINHLTKNTVLPFARERHAFKDGDVQRVKNQQKVITAIIDKVSSSKTLISKYTNLLDAISENFSTNLDTKSISRLVKLQLDEMPKWKIESQNLIGEDGMEKCYSIPNMNLYVMKQNSDSVNSAKEKINQFFNN